MANELTVLVLGVGGNVSQGILKALALSKLPCRVVGACIGSGSAGLYMVERAYISPRADDQSFIEWLINVCHSEDVKAVLSGVEPILDVLACHANLIREHTGAICIVSSPECLAIGNDKLLTCKWLEKNRFNFPHYADAQDKVALEALVSECGYPLIAKPRWGKGSQDQIKIRHPREMEIIANQPGYVVQEYLGDPESEYTVGCFSDCQGRVRGAIVMQRELLQGTTYRVVLGEFKEIRNEAVRIAAALKPIGSCNIQLRMSHDCPTCFEINTRFSGTTPIRAHFGFNEVEAALRCYVLNEPAFDLPLVTEGVVLRYWNEIYVDSKSRALLDQFEFLENTKNHPFFQGYERK